MFQHEKYDNVQIKLTVSVKQMWILSAFFHIVIMNSKDKSIKSKGQLDVNAWNSSTDCVMCGRSPDLK